MRKEWGKHGNVLEETFRSHEIRLARYSSDMQAAKRGTRFEDWLIDELHCDQRRRTINGQTSNFWTHQSLNEVLFQVIMIIKINFEDFNGGIDIRKNAPQRRRPLAGTRNKSLFSQLPPNCPIYQSGR